MRLSAVVGLNWGDEGKGKNTDLLAERSDMVIRFQGGANAGHTIINDYGRFALHILPSGIFYPHVTNIIGNGVALDVVKLVEELKSITDQGVPAPKLIISERAQLLMPYHVLQDSYEEERLGGKAFGSTKSGIAPFYSDKYAKIGIQVCDLFDEERLRDRLTRAVELKNVMFQHLYHKPALDVEALFQQLLECREMIRPYVGDAVTFVHEALAQGKAHAALLFQLHLLALEDKTARSLGVNVNRSRIVISVIAVLLAGIATAVIGPISFLGLIVPHIARLLVGSNHKILVPYTILLGAFTLLLADTVGRTIAAPYEISASVIMSVVGGPFFIILLRRSRQSYGQ